MADLDQTIEELEKEVKAELEEAAHDAPTKGSGKACLLYTSDAADE